MAVQAATMDGTPCPKSLAVFKIFRLPQAPQRACALPGHGRAGLPTWLSKTISCQMQAAAEALHSHHGRQMEERSRRSAVFAPDRELQGPLQSLAKRVRTEEV